MNIKQILFISLSETTLLGGSIGFYIYSRKTIKKNIKKS